MSAEPLVTPRPSGAPAELSPTECWARLGVSGIGHLAVRHGERVEVVPIDYLVHEKRLYFRSAPGAKLAALAQDPAVALEVEGRTGRTLWTVLVTGRAQRLDADEEILASGVAELRTTAEGERHNFVRIEPDSVSGRRVAPRRED